MNRFLIRSPILNRLTNLTAAGLLILSSTFAAHADEGPATSRPNIIVFLVDDMGLMDTSVPFLTDTRGVAVRHELNQFHRTPNMERLAARGIRFNQFYAMSVCSPSRISLMTGQNAARHHTTQWIRPEGNNGGRWGPADWNWRGLKADDVTLPRCLQSAGYRTIHVGKGHFGPFDSQGADPLNLGFDVNIAGRAIGAPGSYFASDHYGNHMPSRPGRRKWDQGVPHLEKYHDTETHLTEALTLEAISQIDESIDQQKPFFLHLAHYAVHSPYQSDPRFAKNYVDQNVPDAQRRFATLIEGMDQSLGELMTHLESRGIASRTLLLFVGDNGSASPRGGDHTHLPAAPLRGRKGTHYEGGTRVPMIAAWVSPRPELAVQSRLPIAAGQIQSQVANICDLFPTILQVAGVDVPGERTIDGQSLAILTAGHPDPEHSIDFLMHFPHEHHSSYYSTLRSGDWKIIRHWRPKLNGVDHEFELFNLAKDPYETDDLHATESGKLVTMKSRLQEALTRHDAQLATVP